tara:strand:- start:14 stop:145 length:132 start_codon:yes stop_codon:yes gene_type:complete
MASKMKQADGFDLISVDIEECIGMFSVVIDAIGIPMNKIPSII